MVCSDNLEKFSISVKRWRRVRAISLGIILIMSNRLSG
jgi:hypothetical protein